MAGGPLPLSPNAYRHHSSGGTYTDFSHDYADLDMSTDIGTANDGYTVHIPPTPDNQPMVGMPGYPAIGMKAQQHLVTNNIFTGGFNSMTKSHMLEKMTEKDTHPRIAVYPVSICSMNGCDVEVMQNKQGEELSPCECDYKVCRDCYVDACKAGGTCPGCKEAYKIGDTDDPLHNDQPVGMPLSLAAPDEPNSMEPRLSLVRSKNNNELQMSSQNKSQNNDFDHAHWLYETKGTYGFGNAVWPEEPADPSTGGGGRATSLPDFKDRARHPLSRKIKVPAGILSPYR